MSKRKSGDALTTWLFLRGIAFVYLIAFTSCAFQITALVGHNGLLPAERFLHVATEQFGEMRYLAVPSFAWINAGDLSLELICLGGIIAALLAMAGIFTLPALLLCYLLYLSLISIGQVFLSYQWDWLLLEAGFISIFLAPLKFKEFQFRKELPKHQPSMLIIWMVRMLIFKLMFMSGAAKIASGDPAWANLTALDYHYWTQPLPTPLGWLAGQLPEWMQKVSVVVMFMVELVAPFLILVNRHCRLIAALLIVMLQLLIGLTGNYTFFNLLSIVLCIPLLDDQWLLWLGQKLKLRQDLPQEISAPAVATNKPAVILRILVAVLLVSLNVRELTGLEIPGMRTAVAVVSSFGISNGYGLFAVMTTTRNEIILEGSNDRATWLAYELPFKPGDIKRAPPVVAPYQPRLDWQLWFASLSTYEDEPWFGHLVFSLLKGNQEVLRLFSKNPFPDAPPKYIRASFYSYKFTDIDTLTRTGQWWQRTYVGPYFPAASLQGPEPVFQEFPQSQ